MNKAKIICSLLMLSMSTFAAKQEEQDFINKYLVNEELEALLDAHTEEIEHVLNEFSNQRAHKKLKKHGVWAFDWLPGYFVKYNLERIHGMEKMRTCIEKFNLDLIKLPDKRIYHLKNRPRALNNSNYVVVINKIEQAENLEPLNLRQVEQLRTLMKHTGYVSMTKTNYIRGKDGSLTMIDTESTFDYKNPFLGLRRLLSAGHKIGDYTQEAIKYILREISSIIHTYKPAGGYKEIIGYLSSSKSTGKWHLIEYFNQQLS